MKESLNIQIGNRIKAIRNVYNEGIRLTVEQFSHLLDISNEQLLNYENGRSALPINILLELYSRGVNPMFVLTGEGDALGNNDAGDDLREKFKVKNIDYNRIINNALASIPADSTLSFQAIKVSAGKVQVEQ